LPRTAQLQIPRAQLEGDGLRDLLWQCVEIDGDLVLVGQHRRQVGQLPKVPRVPDPTGADGALEFLWRSDPERYVILLEPGLRARERHVDLITSDSYEGSLRDRPAHRYFKIERALIGRDRGQVGVGGCSVCGVETGAEGRARGEVIGVFHGDR
jgi:hypothetical protein